MSDYVLVEVADRIATITLNRPQKLNAMTPEMADAIGAAIEDCNRGDEVRCVIVTGAGEKAFCAGSDIGDLDSYETPWQFRNRRDYCDALRELLKPSICAVNGYAFGGGLEMAMSCDIRIASENARFAAPEIKLGWIGGGGMTMHLAHSIGMSNAALMIMTGDPIDAARALAWGLVSEVVPQGRLMVRAREVARTIASRAPIAAETAKLNLRAAHAMPPEKAIEYERDLQTICFATEDARRRAGGVQGKARPRLQAPLAGHCQVTNAISLPRHGTFLGRAKVAGKAHPVVVTVRDQRVFDITSRAAPTVRDVCELTEPAAYVRSIGGTAIGALADIAANSFEAARDPGRPFLLSPVDLQAVKASGVTFVASLLERVIEEQARGSPERAESMRADITALIGDDLSKLRPGSREAMAFRQELIARGAWSQYLEVGIGPDAEIFTKCQPLASVGYGADVGLHPISSWNNPEPEVAVVVSSRGTIVGSCLGNDVNLRDVEGQVGFAARQGQGQQCVGGAWSVRAALRRRFFAGRPQAGYRAPESRGRRRLPAGRFELDEPDQPLTRRTGGCRHGLAPPVSRRHGALPRHDVRALEGSRRSG